MAMASRICLMLVALMVGVVFGSVAMTETGRLIYFNGTMIVERMKAYDKDASNMGDQDFYNNGVFTGYVVGVIDANRLNPKHPVAGAKVNELCAIVAKYLKNNPEKWHLSGAVLVAEAINEAFPVKPIPKPEQAPPEK
jgi:hypothetical protein